MSKEILYGIIGLLIGVMVTVFVAQTAVNTNNSGMMRMMGMRGGSTMMGQNQLQNNFNNGRMGMGSSMQDMMGSLKDKSGDEFDKVFIESMIIHHQGAINMAEQAKVNAFHDELKKMADDIISAQTKEIETMRQWQKNWGY
ncbi:DUF305 domain-containing protein [Candidatus Daviesbacteria bacterium]|nr:DUF305 domain-containing protein [Candidatus Daviesbacteria bacterium]